MSCDDRTAELRSVAPCGCARRASGTGPSPYREYVDTVLVTGGAGFIGSALVRLLVGGGTHRVVTVDKLTYAGDRESLAEVAGNPLHRFERIDVCDAAAVRDIIADTAPQTILHLAAESHVDRSIDAPAPFMTSNVMGTFTLLQECLRHWRTLPAERATRFRFVQVSTDEVFGTLGATGRFDADSAYAPRSPYAASKAAADHLARAWHHTYGLPTIVTHSTNNYGPFQFPDKLVPLMTQRAIEGNALPLYGDGRHVRDWLYVDDHARALMAVASRGAAGASYHIGAECERPNREIAEAICRLVDELAPHADIPDRRALITAVPDRPGHDYRYAIDPSATRRALGWAPQVTLAEGLRRTVEWQLGHQAWIARVQAGRYDGRRLGVEVAR